MDQNSGEFLAAACSKMQPKWGGGQTAFTLLLDCAYVYTHLCASGQWSTELTFYPQSKGQKSKSSRSQGNLKEAASKVLEFIWPWRGSGALSQGWTSGVAQPQNSGLALSIIA